MAEDKIESFGKVLQKFFDTEREDYKKDAAAKIPDYDYLVKKAGQAGTSFANASCSTESGAVGEYMQQVLDPPCLFWACI